MEESIIRFFNWKSDFKFSATNENDTIILLIVDEQRRERELKYFCFGFVFCFLFIRNKSSIYMKFSEVYNCAPTIGVLIYMHAHFELGRKHSKCTRVNWKQTLSAIVSASQSFMGCIHLDGENCISHIRWIIQVSVEYQPRNYSRCCKEDGSSD